ncbi:hypothetical protein PHMEG_0003492, partial [Phytophthora megakarya]
DSYDNILDSKFSRGHFQMAPAGRFNPDPHWTQTLLYVTSDIGHWLGRNSHEATSEVGDGTA